MTIVETSCLRSGNTKSCGCYKSEITKKLNKEIKKKHNTYDLSGEYGIGYTFKGEEFYFDLEDYELIKNYCWRIHNKGYVACSINKGEYKIDLMFHRLVLKNADDCCDIDHINGTNSRNDNRKNNLRICSHADNMKNYSLPSNNTSGIIGVSYCNTHCKWKAYVTCNGKRINLGSFNNKEDAIKSRLLGEIKYFGEYASQKHLYEQYGIEVS